jgi:hypothetical protein
MDGRLRRVSEHTWEGTLRGYRVQVFESLGSWYVAFIHPDRFTEANIPVASFREGVKLARAWIEERLGPDGPGLKR